MLGTGEVPGHRTAAVGGRAGSGVAPLNFVVKLGFKSRNRRGRQRGRELPTYLYDATTPRMLTTPRHYAYVKIGEGCDYTCAFCIIPTLRGKYRSRDEDSIVAEAERLAAGGVRELLLISQDTTFFGVDRGQRDGLGRLLRRLNAVDGLSWVRLLYLYPTTISDDVLDVMAECEKVCRYVDLPLQHASAMSSAACAGPATVRPTTSCSRDRARASRASRSGRRSSSASPARPNRTSRSSATSSATPLRPRRRVHVLARGRHAGVCDGRRRPGGDEKGTRERLMQVQQRIVAKRQRAGVGEVDMGHGGRPVARRAARLPGTARRPGARHRFRGVLRCGGSPRRSRPALVDVELTAARGYDFVAVPTALALKNSRA